MSTLELHIVVTGHVQGVFFRNSTRQIAQELNLKGTVRNLRDGAVEIFIQGSQDQLDNFLERLTQNPGFGRIDQLQTTYSLPNQQFDQFCIIK